jgi:peptide/nickel transport system substrate-binding protein
MRSKRASSSTGASGDAAVRKSRRGLRYLIVTAAIAIGALVIAACGGSSTPGGGQQVSQKHTKQAVGTILYGSLPSAGSPGATQGTISIGQQSSAVPTWFFPIATGANSATQNINLADQVMTPLFYGPNGAVPEDNSKLGLAAGDPVPSNGDKTYTITIRTGWKWPDGKPITTTDVIFGYKLLRAAVDQNVSNWGQIVPGQFPQSVTSVKAIGNNKVQFNLNKAYNPGYFLYNQVQDTNWGLYAMPSTVWNVDAAGKHVTDWMTNESDAKKIYTYLNKQASDLGTWDSNPLWKDGDGPYQLSSFNTTSSAYTLTPNKSYSGADKPSDTISYQTFTSLTAELNALKTGTLDIGGLDPSELAQVPALKSGGYSVYGGPGFGWFGGIINFDDKTDDFNNVIKQVYVRGAIDSLIDQPAIIKAVYHGAAVPQYASVPSAPTSPYAPKSATTPTYPYSTTNAAKVLKAHGWDVKPGGVTTCAKAGTAADECGAGIPVGTPIKFVWANPPESASTTAIGESTVLASAAKQNAGIDIELTTESEDFLFQNYDDQVPGDKKYENDWGVNNVGGVYTDYFPTASGIWTPGGGFNFGDYSDPTANSLVNASVFGKNPKAVENEVNYEAKALPAFFFPALDNLVAVSNKVGGSPTAFLALTQQQDEPQFFYLKK